MVGQGEDAGGTPDVAFTLHASEGPAGGGESTSPGEPYDAGGAPDVDEHTARDAPSAAAKVQELVRSPGIVDTRGQQPGNPSVSAGPVEANESDTEPADEAGGPDRIQSIAEELIALAPDGWDRLYAEFAVTVSAGAAQAVFTAGGSEIVVDVPPLLLTRVREYRTATAEHEPAPWWRLLLHITPDGVIESDFDYGQQPFPDNQLFAPGDYRADLEAFPRDRLPVWLAAYLGHDGRQTRSPQRAAAMARADRANSVWSELAENEFPPFPAMWARWATLAAAFTAAGSEWGPRMLPALGWFESSRRSGVTLYVLPGERAVLSGGVWDAPNLDAVYNGSATMPNFYAGAPEWVADPILNPRAASGLMSFCYWWEGGRWYRGESPPARDCAPALPGVWAAETVADIVTRVISPSGDDAAVLALVEAAEAGVATEDTVREAFGDSSRIDLGSALFQLRVAGVLTDIPATLPEGLAILRVRQYIEGRGLDTTGYPLDSLVADRLDCGWMVYVPVPNGEIAIGRAIFYIADDGVLEPSSSSVPPARFVADFEKRFRQRRGVGAREALGSLERS
ncbi:hypothetical protein ACPESR_06975 [Nocardia testacea]|uniref:hypothetical protein n=1 Tax=Nocardia testacea TaxID=248551 RepID=UPI003C30B390